MTHMARFLDELGLTVARVRELCGRERSRYLNFLLRWEKLDALHTCLDVLIPCNPTHVSLRDLRAKALLVQGRADEALQVMEERLQWRKSLPARALLARIHLSRGGIARAREIARAMTEESDDSVMAWALRGQIELAGGDTEAAQAAYRRVRDLRPNGRAYMRGMLAICQVQSDLVAASGYAVRLLGTARDGYPLSVGDLRSLRDYFRASGETTRRVEMEAQLERRYCEELNEIRDHVSLAGVPYPSSKTERLDIGPIASSADADDGPADSLPSFEHVPVSDDERDTITRAAQQFFGFDALLPGQLETMACVLRGEDVLTVLPTGGGKSLCYQLPALLAEASEPEVLREGNTLVISPLIALMKDQIDSLPSRVRPRATTINSTLDGDELRRRVNRIANGVYRLIYVAPERLRQPPFLHAVRRGGIGRLVIDEAHCVSMWGHDFRPDYLIIGQIRQMLGDPPILAMTATAPKRVRRDILERLGEQQGTNDGPRVVAGDLTRSNLRLEVLHTRDNDEKLRQLLAFCRAEEGSGIVYADTRTRCERLAALLRQHGVNAAHYHAGIDDRHRVQDDFMTGRIRVAVATIAFGMGIDKPDIRFILHFFLPASLESYYQEAGRAGRDGLPARCLLMISPHDKGLLTRRTRRDEISVAFLRQFYAAVKDRLGGKPAGRIAMADLERDLRTDDTRLRVALSLLEQAGLMRRGPDLPRAALVRLSAVCRDSALPDDVASFRRAGRLRPQQWLTVDLAEVAPKSGIPLVEIEQRMLTWEDAGWLMYRPAGRDLLVELRRAPEDAGERIHTLLERYRAVQAQRVDEIVAYATTRRCRHGHLNAYLGGRAIERCDACDNCVEIPPLPDPGLPDDRAQLLLILRCAANGPWSWGRHTLLRILRGASKVRYGRHSLHARALEHDEFGALAFRSETAVKAMIEGLEYAGFLEPRRLDHGGVVLDITADGRAALEDPGLLDVLIMPDDDSIGSASCAAVTVPDPDVDERLFELLKAWRLEQAREQRLAPFMIFHDSHLRAIAAHRPATLSALAAVKGVGPKRLERYGADVVDLVRGHLRSSAKEKGKIQP